MSRKRELLESLVNGSLSQSEWQELSELIGTEKINEIQRADATLRRTLIETSIKESSQSEVDQILSSVRSNEKANGGFVRFMSKWGLLVGIIFLVCVGIAVVAVFPSLTTSTSVEGATQSDGSNNIYAIGTLGAVILACLGIAAWLEWSDRF